MTTIVGHLVQGSVKNFVAGSLKHKVEANEDVMEVKYDEMDNTCWLTVKTYDGQKLIFSIKIKEI